MKDNELPACNCHHKTVVNENATIEAVKKTARPAGPALLSLLIAFFPKCPICLAAYLSMFGSAGLAISPYKAYLLPLLFCMLTLHFWMMAKKVRQKGYMPLLVSLLGIILIISGRLLFAFNPWVLYVGMGCIVTGSLMNNLISKPIDSYLFHKKPIQYEKQDRADAPIAARSAAGIR